MELFHFGLVGLHLEKVEFEVELVGWYLGMVVLVGLHFGYPGLEVRLVFERNVCNDLDPCSGQVLIQSQTPSFDNHCHYYSSCPYIDCLRNKVYPRFRTCKSYEYDIVDIPHI